MRGPALAAELDGVRVERQRPVIHQLVVGVVVCNDKLIIKVAWPALAGMLGISVQPTDEDVLEIEAPGRLSRSGRAVRMIQQDGRLTQPSVDFKLVKLIVKARSWWQRLQLERGLTVTKLAASENITQSYVTRVLRLAFLSPEVIHAIMIGKQPAWLDSGALCHCGAIALDWELQKEALLLGRAA